MLRGLLFDIDHVFFDGSYWHRLLHQMICRLGKREQFHAFRNQWQWEFLPKVYRGELKYWDALASFFCSMGLNESEARELLVTSQAKLKYAQDNLRAFPTVNETLQELRRRKIRLGIVTNSIHQSPALVGILADIKIGVPFDYVMTSRSAGRVLPDSAIFNEGLLGLILRDAEVGYVSARPDRLAIAAHCGLTPIWLNEFSSAPDSTTWPIPVVEIQQFSDLVCLSCLPTHETHAA